MGANIALRACVSVPRPPVGKTNQQSSTLLVQILEMPLAFINGGSTITRIFRRKEGETGNEANKYHIECYIACSSEHTHTVFTLVNVIMCNCIYTYVVPEGYIGTPVLFEDGLGSELGTTCLD